MSEVHGKIIKVAGNYYTVNVNPQIAVVQGNWGLCSYGDNTIQIADGLCENRTHDVLVHEMTHALLYEAGYDDHEEEQCNRIAKVLYQMLCDNDFGFLRKENNSNDELEELY
jgi:hypothetical protein